MIAACPQGDILRRVVTLMATRGAVPFNIDVVAVVVAKRRTSSRRASMTTSRAALSDYDDDVERLPEALDLCRLTDGSYAAVRWVRNDGETMTMDVVVLAAEASSSSRATSPPRRHHMKSPSASSNDAYFAAFCLFVVILSESMIKS